MVTQPTGKAQKTYAFDWLCWVLVTFGLFCLGVSLPATFQMVSVAHDEVGSYLLLLVLEMMGFFSLLAPLWVSPVWAKKFGHIATGLLTLTTIGNYVAGWNYLWTQAELPSLWKGLRDYELIGGFYPFAVLLVGLLSAAVPFGMKFFIGLAIQRYRENEMEHTPEAVAQRMVEPFVVQVVATRMMQEQMLALTGQFNNPLVLTGPANSNESFERMRADAAHQEVEILRQRLAERQEGEQRHPFEPVGLSTGELDAAWQAVRTAQINAQAAHLDQQMMEDPQAAVEASDENDWEQEWPEDEPMPLEEALAELATEGWEHLSWEAMDVLPDSDEKAAELERRRLAREKLKDIAIEFATSIGLLKPKDTSAEPSQEAAGIAEPVGAVDGMDVWAEARTEAPAAVSTWTCAGCDAEGSNGSKGVAKKWSTARGLGDKLYCKACRDGGQYGS